MTNVTVSDTGSNQNRNIRRAVEAIGRSKPRRQVFEALYFHKKKIKTVQEIADVTRLSRKVVLTHGNYLVRRELADQVKKNGDTAYQTRAFYQHHKTKILSLVDNPKQLEKLTVEREPVAMMAPLSFMKAPPKRKRATDRATGATKAKVRLALLVTNPERTASLQTGIEARDIQKAIESAPKGNEFEVKVVLAPTFDDLIDALNQFDPQILHFSGHGGGRALLLDNERAGQDGGEVLDFNMAARLMSATEAKICLIVLAACDTTVGAECLLAPGRVLVAMSESIEDEAACAFSARFYKSLASQVSIRKSLEQAKLLLEQKGYQDATLPTLLSLEEQDCDRKFV
ncbi:MAG TPA: CHAT domain-containing protein [Sphingomonadaceae bacterium]